MVGLNGRHDSVFLSRDVWTAWKLNAAATWPAHFSNEQNLYYLFHTCDHLKFTLNLDKLNEKDEKLNIVSHPDEIIETKTNQDGD